MIQKDSFALVRLTFLPRLIGRLHDKSVLSTSEYEKRLNRGEDI